MIIIDVIQNDHSICAVLISKAFAFENTDSRKDSRLGTLSSFFMHMVYSVQKLS